MLILSIPFLSKEFVIKNLEHLGFEFFEIRIDYTDTLKNVPIKIFSSKTIATIRDINEGGKYFFTDEEKLRFYQRIIKEKNSLIDCEIEFYKKFRAKLNPENIILSYHNYERDAIEKDKIEEILSYSNKVKFIKIAPSISDYRNLEIVSRLIKNYENVIFLSMGNAGVVSRLLYKKLNSVATYVGLDNFQTSNGQFSLSQLKKWFDPKIINEDTKIGGIVGGNQILHSIGLGFYNNYFRKNNINAVYLPFITDNLKNLLDWLKSMKFYGLSVTMPFKKEIVSIFKSKLKSANLFLLPNRLFNTDLTAFKKAIEYLNIDKKDNILIYGSGGVTITALSAFEGYRIYLASRNLEKRKDLSKKFKIKLEIPTHCDILINCTPLGLSEDFFEKSKIKIRPKKIIDLPYHPNKDTSLIEFAKANNIPYVDGKMFWKWQSERQLSLFVEKINKYSIK